VDRLAGLGRNDLGELFARVAQGKRDLAAYVAARDHGLRRPLGLGAPGDRDRGRHVLGARPRDAAQQLPVRRPVLVEPFAGRCRRVLPVDVVRNLLRNHQADQPPSTTRLAPVMYEDASDARKTIAPSASLACAIRPRGTRAVYASRNSVGWSLKTPASVSVLTRTPLFAQ